MENCEKKFPAASQAKKKIHEWPGLRKKIHACIVKPKKIVTNHKRPIPTCGLLNLSRLHTSCALLFNKARFPQEWILLSSQSLINISMMFQGVARPNTTPISYIII